MECYGLFSISTHELKTLLHASLNAFSREEIWHVYLITWLKILGRPATLLQVETSEKHSISSEFSGESVVTGTVADFEIARIHVCPVLRTP